MSENIQSISNGTYTLGSTNKLTFSAGQGIKIDEPSEGTVRIGNDETVLWSSTAGTATTDTSCTFSESWKNFDHINIQYKTGDGWINDMNLYGAMGAQKFMITCDNYNGTNYWLKPQRFNISNTAISFDYGAQFTFSTTGVSRSLTGAVVYLYKVIGINRISGSNA